MKGEKTVVRLMEDLKLAREVGRAGGSPSLKSWLQYLSHGFSLMAKQGSPLSFLLRLGSPASDESMGGAW